MNEESHRTSKIVKYGGGFIGVCVALGIISAAIQGSHGPIPQPDNASAIPETIAAPVAQSDEPEIPSPQDLAQQFSDYAGAVAEKLNLMSFTGMTFAARLKQDAEYADLPDQRKDAEALRESLQGLEKDINTISLPLNLPEADFDRFNDVQQAAETIAMDSIEVAVTIAVEANTGINTSDGNDPTDADIRRAKKAFKSAVLKGYKQFGVMPQRINMETFTLKK